MIKVRRVHAELVESPKKNMPLAMSTKIDKLIVGQEKQEKITKQGYIVLH